MLSILLYFYIIFSGGECMSFVHNSLMNQLCFHVEFFFFFFFEIRASRTEGNIFTLIDIDYFVCLIFSGLPECPGAG